MPALGIKATGLRDYKGELKRLFEVKSTVNAVIVSVLKETEWGG